MGVLNSFLPGEEGGGNSPIKKNFLPWAMKLKCDNNLSGGQM